MLRVDFAELFHGAVPEELLGRVAAGAIDAVDYEVSSCFGTFLKICPDELGVREGCTLLVGVFEDEGFITGGVSRRGQGRGGVH